ncbi:MAG: diguanylate cyclase [Deltaproteobacteria bacterium]|nr:diguanylate cyclase [Deltaproteobacteria bacterium]
MKLLSTTRTRIAFAVSVVALLGATGIAVLVWWQRATLEQSANQRLQARASELDRLVELTDRSLGIFTTDYTRWDDFVAYLAGTAPAFIDEQLVPGMKTFEVDGAWVLRADLSLACVASLDPAGPARPSPVPSPVLRRLLGGRRWFQRFFVADETGVFYVRVAPIQPDADVERRSEPKGFLLAARRYTPERLGSLGELAVARIRLEAAGPMPPAQFAESNGRIVVVRPLPGADGAPVAYLVAEGTLPGQAELEQGLRHHLVVFGALGLVTLALVVGGLELWVGGPLRRIRRALEQNRPASLGSLADDQTEFGAVARGLTRYFQQQEELRERAQHDALTGLPTRVLTTDRLRVAVEQARRYGRTAGVLMIDLDGFKSVNDSLGHDAGDAVLKEVGARLAAVVRASDTVGRMGGDEFVAVLPEITHPVDAEIVARRIVEALGAPFFVEDHDFRLGTSVGIALCPIDGSEAAALIQRADEAMYRAKKRGKGRFAMASEDASVGALERSAFLADLRVALDLGQVGVRYVPRVDLATGAVVGAEAVIHWDRGEAGDLRPAELLRLAEETGVIVSLEDRVLRTVCVDAAGWLAAGRKPGVISLRCSARRLLRSPNVDELLRVVQGSGLPAGNLEVRVSESTLLLHHAAIGGALQRIHEAGLRIALDEFGLAAASLNLIRESPIDVVVFAQEFVARLQAGSDRAALLSAVVALSRNMDRPRVVAAGVPGGDALILLRTLGCHSAQGAAVSGPLDATGYAARLAATAAGC